MKKLLLSSMLAASLGAMAMAASAATSNPVSNPAPDGTVTITGNVIAQTCLVDGNAAGTADNKTVQLVDVLSSDFSAKGSVAAPKNFSVNITKCDASLSTVQAYFTSFNNSIDTTNGNLVNQATSNASDVEVQLLNGSGNVMNLAGTTATNQNSQVVNLTAGTATLTYSAQYYALNYPVKAGGVNTNVNFTLVYQ